MSIRLQLQESESLLNVTIYWMGGHNLDRSFSLLDSTSEYTFQVSHDPDTQTVSCISPPPGVDINVFPEHPFYLPRWPSTAFINCWTRNCPGHIQTFLDIPILVPSNSENELEPAIDTQTNNNTSSESNSKAPQKRRANLLEVTMDDKKNFQTCWKKTEM